MDGLPRCIKCDKQPSGMLPTDDGYVCGNCILAELKKLREENADLKKKDPPCSDERRGIIHGHINDTPHLLSYLWDSGLMPEQLTPNSKAHHFVLGICWGDLHRDHITDISKHI